MKDSPGSHATCPAQGLLPFHGECPEILILGSFPSRQSLQKKEYYGNQQNHFWHIMEDLYTIDRKLPYNVRTSRLAEQRVALWDVLSCCCRAGSADNRIREPVFNDLPGFLKSHPTLHLVVLNGSTAGRYYHTLTISTPVPSVILPSTSPANTRFTLAEKVKAWAIIRIHNSQ